MESEVTTLSPVMKEVRVQVPWDRVEGDIESRLARILKTAKIKGFRPGKAPKNVVRRVYGPNLRRDVMTSLLEEGLAKAMQEHKIVPVARPTFDIPEFEQGKPLEFSAKLEVQPELKNLKLEGVEVEEPSIEVEDEEIAKELEKLQEEQVQLKVPEPPRPAKDGDEVQFDFRLEIEGSENEEMNREDQRAVLGAGRLLPELNEALPGGFQGR